MESIREEIETCVACSCIETGETGLSGHSMLRFVGQRRNTYIGQRGFAIEEYICYDCGSRWEHKNWGDDASAGWRFIKNVNH
jgi:hypothetical protein